MVVFTFNCPVDLHGMISAELYEAGTLGILEEDVPGGNCILRAYFADPASASRAEVRLRAFAPVVETCEDRDWTQAWRRDWSPVVLGDRLYLAPDWSHDPTPPGRLRVRMPAGTVFGTGLHASTQLSLVALERRVRPGDWVLDLGTGSGILSAAAAALGAGSVFACDIDADAAGAARAYLPRRVGVFIGSVRSLRSASVDLIAANLNAVAIAGLAGELARAVKPEGCVIAAGIRDTDTPRLLLRLTAAGLLVNQTLNREEWTCLILSRGA